MMPFDAFAVLPETLVYLVASAVYVAKIGAAGFILVKAGRSPIWALVLLLPLVEVVAVWVFACHRWPRQTAATRAAR